jgi:hypothetical protein
MGFIISDSASNHADIRSLANLSDVIRARTNSFYEAGFSSGDDSRGAFVDIMEEVLDRNGGGDLGGHVFLPSGSPHGRCTLRRSPTGLILLRVVTDCDYIYVALDPAKLERNKYIPSPIVDGRVYQYDTRQAQYFKRDFSQSVWNGLDLLLKTKAMQWLIRTCDPLPTLSQRKNIVGEVLLVGGLVAIVGTIFAILFRRLRELVGHRRFTIAAITLALGSLAFAVLFLFV